MAEKSLFSVADEERCDELLLQKRKRNASPRSFNTEHLNDMTNDDDSSKENEDINSNKTKRKCSTPIINPDNFNTQKDKDNCSSKLRTNGLIAKPKNNINNLSKKRSKNNKDYSKKPSKLFCEDVIHSDDKVINRLDFIVKAAQLSELNSENNDDNVDYSNGEKSNSLNDAARNLIAIKSDEISISICKSPLPFHTQENSNLSCRNSPKILGTQNQNTIDLNNQEEKIECLSNECDFNDKKTEVSFAEKLKALAPKHSDNSPLISTNPIVSLLPLNSNTPDASHSISVLPVSFPESTVEISDCTNSQSTPQNDQRPINLLQSNQQDLLSNSKVQSNLSSDGQINSILPQVHPTVPMNEKLKSLLPSSQKLQSMIPGNNQQQNLETMMATMSNGSSVIDNQQIFAVQSESSFTFTDENADLKCKFPRKICQ